MLKCRDIAEHGSLFIDRTLPWYKRPGWYLHLFICGNCRRFILHLRTTIKVVAGLPHQSAAAEKVATIIDALPEQTFSKIKSDPTRD